jgi:hypothetical protein
LELAAPSQSSHCLPGWRSNWCHLKPISRSHSSVNGVVKSSSFNADIGRTSFFWKRAARAGRNERGLLPETSQRLVEIANGVGEIALFPAHDNAPPGVQERFQLALAMPFGLSGGRGRLLKVSANHKKM